MVTRDDLKAASWSTLFLDGSDFWQRVATCQTFPGLSVVDQGPRGRRSKVKRERRVYFRGELFETIEAAVAAINREQGAA